MMRKVLILVSLLGTALLLAGCGSGAFPEQKESGSKEPSSSKQQDAEDGDGETAYHKITAEDAKTMMDEGEVMIVDVRTQEEYDEAHIKDAVLLPHDSIGSEPPSELPDKDAVLLIYCRSGNRSRQASDRLVEMGYSNVYDFGGINDWPYETESGAQDEQ